MTRKILFPLQEDDIIHSTPEIKSSSISRKYSRRKNGTAQVGVTVINICPYRKQALVSANCMQSRHNDSWEFNGSKWFFLPSAHWGCRILSCPALSLRPSAHPVLVTTLQSTIFNGPCSYLVQPLTLVETWILSIMGFLCSFCRIQWHFEIWIHWLTCFMD